MLEPVCTVEDGLAAALPSLVETAWQLQPSRLHQPSVDKVSTYVLQLKAMKDARGFIPCKPAASTRHTLHVTFSTFDETHTPADVFDVFEYMGGVNGPNLMGQTASCKLGKHQSKWLCRAVGSPPHDRSKTVCPRPPPTKSVHVDFKNACARNPPARARQNMCSTRRPIFCTTVRIFRGSAAPSSP